MEKVEDFFVRALETLGGAEQYVAGAALGAKAHKMAELDGFNLRNTLKASRRTMLQTLVESPSFDVVERTGTDFLVRLRATNEPEPGHAILAVTSPRSQRLRDDAYAALTRTGKRFVYNKKTDAFYPVSTTDDIDEDIVALPEVTNDLLLHDRELFVETLGEPLHSQAVNALRGAMPLSVFKQVLRANRTFDQWIIFHNQLLMPRLRDWATSEGIGFSNSWYEEKRLDTEESAFRRAVQQIIDAMPDEDLAQLQIPMKYLRLLLP